MINCFAKAGFYEYQKITEIDNSDNENFEELLEEFDQGITGDLQILRGSRKFFAESSHYSFE